MSRPYEIARLRNWAEGRRCTSNNRHGEQCWNWTYDIGGICWIHLAKRLVDAWKQREKG